MDIKGIRERALKDVAAADSAEAVEAARVKYLGRQSGELTGILRSLGELPIEERKKIGPEANALRAELEAAIKAKLGSLKSGGESLGVDITTPVAVSARGHLHPLTRVLRRVEDIFIGLGFSVVEGSEAESEHYNFDALNIPGDHPARDMWDTFWIEGGDDGERGNRTEKKTLLRTHTSPMQVRYMKRMKPPFQIIVPGRVFRFEATDASHEINFHQVEGLMVGERVSLANFKSVIEQFLNEFFGEKVKTRFRPSYFPFTEPSLEVDVEWKGKWLELMGAGMVHQNVLKAVGYDPKKVKGFAFGMGLERLAMIQYKIPDIRLFYSGDVRVTDQF